MDRSGVWLLVVIVGAVRLIIGTGSVAAEDVDDEYMSACRQDLGMNSGAIPDSAINASSSYDLKSVGPLNARIRTEKNGGAWCPRPQVGRDATEWLEIDLGELKVISLVETQGRFGNGQGQEFAPSYMVEYQREDGAKWFRFRDRRGTEVLKGNSNTYLAEMRELRPPIVARRIRFVPFSHHPRTVCMRVEVYGCTWTDGLVSYNVRRGDRRGADMEFYDLTYDGQVNETYLAGGLGQLADFETGDTNFRLDIQNNGHKGYEWVGWRNDTSTASPSSVDIVFRFDQARNFSSILVTANNMFTKEVSVFRSAHVYFSVGGTYFSRPPVVYDYLKDTTVEYARQVIIPISPGRVGRYVRLVLYFDLRWIMISEIRFVSAKVNGTLFPVEDKPPDVPPDSATGLASTNVRNRAGDNDDDDAEAAAAVADADKTNSGASKMGQLDDALTPTEFPGVVHVGPHHQRPNDTYVGIVVGALAVFIILIIVVATILMVRLRRKKFGCGGGGGAGGGGGSAGSPSKFIFASADRASHVTVERLQVLPVGVGLKVGNGTVCNSAGGYGGGNTYDKKPNDLNGRLNAAERNPRHVTDPAPMDLNLYASIARPASPPVTSSTASHVTSSCLPTSFTPPTLPRHPSRSVDASNGQANNDDDNDDDSELPWENFADLEFPRECLHLVETLATGDFGNVLLCDAVVPSYLLPNFDSPFADPNGGGSQLVVVKTLNPRAPKGVRLNLYNETEILIGLRDPNIVQVLGVCSRDEPIAVVVEYSEFGDLNQFLLNAVSDQLTDAASRNQSCQMLSYGCLIYMATQIASGMKYLETLNMVHRDLATRNCLVGRKYSIKISDFGMNRKLYNADYYRVDDGLRLPVRWMAWESLLLHQFSCKSDVWAFAVTLWEILTFARKRPFAALSDDQVVANCARCYGGADLGVLLDQPPNCPREIYDLMVECWNRVDVQRPTFREIHMFLQRKNMGYSPTAEWPAADGDISGDGGGGVNHVGLFAGGGSS